MTEKVKAIKERIQAKETRSLWQKNIKDYAVQMLDSCNEDFKVDTLNVGDLVNHVDGNKYPLMWDTFVKNRVDIARICSDCSWGGNFLVYNCELCETFYTPSMQRRALRKDGSMNTNALSVHVLDRQAICLFQAVKLIIQEIMRGEND